MGHLSKDQFLRNCLLMQAHQAHTDRSGVRGLGRYWDMESRRMIQRIKRFPKAPLFSSQSYLLNVFGGGGLMRPDSYLIGRKRPLSARVLSKIYKGMRRLFGYGWVGDFLLGPLASDELIHFALVLSSTNYTHAVSTGFYLLRDAIERYDIRSPELFGEQRVFIEGRPLSWLTLISLKNALLIQQLAGGGETILEIGAGTGELARVLLKMGLAKRYIIVDIAPALAFSQELFLSEFSQAQVDVFDPNRQGLEKDKPYAFLTPDQIRWVQQADLGVNSGSFQEMTRPIVAEYAGLCKRVGLANFISINTRAPHPVNASHGIGEKFYEEVFAPEFRIQDRYLWENSLDVRLQPHGEDFKDYQVIHFVRRETVQSSKDHHELVAGVR